MPDRSPHERDAQRPMLRQDGVLLGFTAAEADPQIALSLLLAVELPAAISGDGVVLAVAA